MSGASGSGPVVAFGELMMRLSPPGHERFLQSPAFRTWFGGSEANVAVGLAHLGHPTRFLSRVPAQAIGDAAVAALRADGVDVSFIERSGDRLGLYFVESGADIRPMRVVYDRAHSAFSSIDPATVRWRDALDGASWLHLSGITPALGDGPAQAAIEGAHAARTAGVRVSLDLNYRPALWGSRAIAPLLRPLASAATLLVGNAGAVQAMLDVEMPAGDDESQWRAAAKRVHEEFGCAFVAFTKRDARSASRHVWQTMLLDAARGDFHVSRRWEVAVVDRVGGGDSFVSGLLYALEHGRAPAEALAFATAASALKLTIAGDFNRVSADEVERLLGTT